MFFFSLKEREIEGEGRTRTRIFLGEDQHRKTFLFDLFFFYYNRISFIIIAAHYSLLTTAPSSSPSLQRRIIIPNSRDNIRKKVENFNWNRGKQEVQAEKEWVGRRRHAFLGSLVISFKKKYKNNNDNHNNRSKVIIIRMIIGSVGLR